MTDDTEEDRSGNLLSLIAQAAHRLPGAEFAQRQIERVEVMVLEELKTRMDRLEPPARERFADDPRPASTGVASCAPRTLGDRMGALMERAAEQSVEQARAALYHQIIDELVPDEARIIGALSEGARYPLVHVGLGPRVGPTLRRIADNFSTLGKPAGVKLLDQVPAYLGHLRALGLLEAGAEDKELEIKYQILESDQMIRRAVEQVHIGTGMTVRYTRRTIYLSAFGLQFWQACQSS